MQHCNWFGFRISLSLSWEDAIFRDEIENYFSCSRLARRDRDYHKTILIFRDESEIPFCHSHVSRRDRDFRKSFLMVEREKMRLTLVENSRDREFSLTSGVEMRKAVKLVNVMSPTGGSNWTPLRPCHAMLFNWNARFPLPFQWIQVCHYELCRRNHSYHWLDLVLLTVYVLTANIIPLNLFFDKIIFEGNNGLLSLCHLSPSSLMN